MKLTSKFFTKNYIQTADDEHVFELVGSLGFQVVRKYNVNEFLSKRIFMTLIFTPKGSKYQVSGFVDMVKKNENPTQNTGWTVEHTPNNKPTNYVFGRDQEIEFFPNEKTIIMDRKKQYTLNEFVDLLMFNHQRDMFLWSRMFSSGKIFYLNILLLLTDRTFKGKEILQRLYVVNRSASSHKEVSEVKMVFAKADPLFHYFHIHKNILGATTLFCLMVLFQMGIPEDDELFSVSNPVLILFAVFILYILDCISNRLEQLVASSTHVIEVFKSSLELQGKLKDHKSRIKRFF